MHEDADESEFGDGLTTLGSGVCWGMLGCRQPGWVREPRSSGSQAGDVAPGDSRPYLEAVLVVIAKEENANGVW